MTGAAVATASVKAGFWIRVVAYIIDLIILIIVSAIVNAVLGNNTALAGLINFIIGIAYFGYFWSASGHGQTLGMRVFKLRVIRTDGSALTMTQAAIRYVGVIVSALAIFIGLIWVAFDPQKQGWHDKIADTYVIRTEA